MSPAAKVPCYCPKCDGILVSVRTERNHRNQGQQSVRPAAGRIVKRQLTKPTVPPLPDLMSTQVPLEEPVHSSDTSNHGTRSTLEDLEDYEMHGNEGHDVAGHVDEHNVNLELLSTNFLTYN
jgi:hypothetical protein